MDQTSATGPKYRQHNLMGVNYPPTFTLPTDADDIDVSVSDGGVEIPGLDPDDVEIKASGDMLTIRGEKKSEEKDDNHYERYFVMPGR